MRLRFKAIQGSIANGVGSELLLLACAHRVVTGDLEGCL